MKDKSTILTSAVVGGLLLVFLAMVIFRLVNLDGVERVEAPDTDLVPRIRPVAQTAPSADGGAPDGAGGRGMFGFSEKVLRMLIAAMAEERAARKREVVLTFNSDEAYNDFLKSLGAGGVKLLGSSDTLRSVRLGFDSYGSLSDLLDGLDSANVNADANYIVSIPPPPNSPESPGAGVGAEPFGQEALDWLGVRGDNSGWGEGVKVAVLDSGIQEHAVFADKVVEQVNYVYDADGRAVPADPNAGHGTAVASIIGGADERLPGIAPAAELMDFRILDNEGYTNSFTLAEAIIAATDMGADVINVSLGSSGNSQLVRDAVDYASANGALIVASTGNEGDDRISFPAALDNVVAVGAVDARGEHLDFSNGGTGMIEGGLAAPGYEVLAAWPDERAINFSGTSASTPYVTGAVAAVMSQNPGMSSHQAYALLLEHSNEAGAPGGDPQYGVGNLNIGRALEAGTSGISDVAVASYYYDPASDNPNEAQVIVENRGTNALHNVGVVVDSGSGDRTYNLSYLEPGDIEVINTPIDAAAVMAQGGLNVSATATMNPSFGGTDRDARDNTLNRTLDFSVPEEN